MKNVKKIAFFVLCMLSAALLICGAAAEEPPYVEWTLSADEETLTGDGKTYTRYYAPIVYEIDAKTKFIYENTVERSDGTATVNSYAKGGEIVWLAREGRGRLYVTDKGRLFLSDLFGGLTALYRLRDTDGRVASFDTATAEMLATVHRSGTVEEMDVRELEDAVRYEIEAYDQTDTILYKYGCVYRLSDGEYYYLHYRTLDNAHFDSDGNFSYRSGSVELTRLSDSIDTVIEDAASRTAYRQRTVTYEYELYEAEPTDADAFSDVSTVVFWILFALLGLVAPIPFLVVGFVLPRSKKRGCPEYWYVLAILAATWLLFAAVLLLVLVV